MVLCEACRETFENDGIYPLKEIRCKVCGKKGIFIPETERSMTYEI